MKIVSNFLNPHVDAKLKELYGPEFKVLHDRILRTFPNYPYPKDVGYWFIRNNELYLVVHER